MAGCFLSLPAGRLSALLDYIGALLVVPGHESEARSAIEALCGIVAAVGERYRQQKDLLSLVLLYESTQAGVGPGQYCYQSILMFAPGSFCLHLKEAGCTMQAVCTMLLQLATIGLLEPSAPC